MLTIISEDGIQRISTVQIQHSNLELIRGLDSNLLSLVFSFHSGSYIIALTIPLLVGPKCLNNKLLVPPGVLKEALYSDESFGPLMSETKDIPGNGLNSDEITLLCYFYLNAMPFSITMITSYFSEIGTKPDRALLLAKAAFIARTDRNESEPWFLTAFDRNNYKSNDHSIVSLTCLFPDALDVALKLLKEKKEVQFTYDCLLPDNPDNSKVIVNLERISELSFLIEDHATIIAGLAISITDLAKISEDKWPLFYIKLLNAIPLYFRDFYSLGKLINVQPEIIQILTSEYHCKTEIISVSDDGRKHSSPINRQRSEFTKSNQTKGIPLFMQISK